MHTCTHVDAGLRAREQPASTQTQFLEVLAGWLWAGILALHAIALLCLTEESEVQAGDVEDVGTDGPPPTEETRDEGAGRSA